eukprot:GHVS01074985.1.p1 GENE.GHVS01074985.1~~GHVS01074985.1.p1  ORF type:complete len:356 (+),score=33.22 GHVS01074985.1:259-1326(+)
MVTLPRCSLFYSLLCSLQNLQPAFASNPTDAWGPNSKLIKGMLEKGPQRLLGKRTHKGVEVPEAKPSKAKQTHNKFSTMLNNAESRNVGNPKRWKTLEIGKNGGSQEFHDACSVTYMREVTGTQQMVSANVEMEVKQPIDLLSVAIRYGFFDKGMGAHRALYIDGAVGERSSIDPSKAAAYSRWEDFLWAVTNSDDNLLSVSVQIANFSTRSAPDRIGSRLIHDAGKMKEVNVTIQGKFAMRNPFSWSCITLKNEETFCSAAMDLRIFHIWGQEDGQFEGGTGRCVMKTVTNAGGKWQHQTEKTDVQNYTMDTVEATLSMIPNEATADDQQPSGSGGVDASTTNDECGLRFNINL